jgi:hypothetical protein
MEAFELARAVAAVDPQYPGVQAALAEVPEEMSSVFDRPLLGSNVALREPVDSPWWVDTLMYVPDRILDVLDIFSFDVHMGLGVYGDVHATRALQASGGFRTVGGFGWNEHRSLGLKRQDEAGLAVAFFGSETYSGTLSGTSSVETGSWVVAGVHMPTDDLYQDFQDYWAVGVGVTAGIIGFDFDVHPLQIVDFAAGLVMLDPLNDDFADTEGLQYSRIEQQLLRELAGVAMDDEALTNYLLWRGQQAQLQVQAQAPPLDQVQVQALTLMPASTTTP